MKEKIFVEHTIFIQEIIKKSWTKIAPSWPLKNLIAVNPLQGFEDLPIEQALVQGQAYFQQVDIPSHMHDVNRETIKWLQAFFDEGQATIGMPLRKNGLYVSWKTVARFDQKLHGKDHVKQAWLDQLPECCELAIYECLLYLEIPKNDWEQFLILMLTTLPGWASYVKYRTDWVGIDHSSFYKISQADYLAIRLATVCLLWPNAKVLLEWHEKVKAKCLLENSAMIHIQHFEKIYQKDLLKKLTNQFFTKKVTPEAQFVFCIDVRSEPFRRALEATGNYETYGFAGFFGIPVSIKNTLTHEKYASCPVLLSPQYNACKSEQYANKEESINDSQRYMIVQSINNLYQSLKRTFTAPFVLAEALGLYAGLWMAIRTFFPRAAHTLKVWIYFKIRSLPSAPQRYAIDEIPLTSKISYAMSALKMIGLTKDFAPLVVLCGHRSSSENNAYASALDCGACGGRPGGPNACILADILNDSIVREALSNYEIFIPHSTKFVGAEHNTTTDEVVLYESIDRAFLDQIKVDLQTAAQVNSAWRCKEMGVNVDGSRVKHVLFRSNDWAQVRPEWGLAKNAAFIVGPRALTAGINLEGRVFLHSYDYLQDAHGALLKAILTAPMVVAQWINMQYLFSTINNVAYGGGSKITQNITGKFAVMQGNASDLMNGLPLQSVYSTDVAWYHEPQRLMTVVYAPRSVIDQVVAHEEVLIKLFANGWITLACIEPGDQKAYILNRDLTWREMH